MVVDEIEGRYRKRVAAHHRQYRPEDLLFVDAHLGLDLVEHAAAEEKAVLVALQLQVAAVDCQFGPLLHPEIDVGAHLVVMLPGDERPHLGLGVGARADLQPPHPRHQLVHQFVADAADGDRCRDGHAALAREP